MSTITYEGTLPGSRIQGEVIERHADGSVTVVHPDGSPWRYTVRPEHTIEDASEQAEAPAVQQHAAPADTFESLLARMADLTWMPLDARERFDAMLQESFTGLVNEAVSA